ncbi:MAG: hypothetical protein WBB67_09825 [bacterium]
MMIGLRRVQHSLFSSSIVLNDVVRTVNNIKQRYPDIFDGDPTILPMPDDAPPQIPFVQLTDKKECYQLNISRSRVDFFFHNKQMIGKIHLPVLQLYDIFLQVFKIMYDEIKAPFNRCAVVVEWAIALDSGSAAEFLKKKYIDSHAPYRNPFAVRLNYLSREVFDDFTTNTWVNLRSARKSNAPEENNFIIVEIDYNTIPEEKYEFNHDAIAKLIKQYYERMNSGIDEHELYLRNSNV